MYLESKLKKIYEYIKKIFNTLRHVLRNSKRFYTLNIIIQFRQNKRFRSRRKKEKRFYTRGTLRDIRILRLNKIPSLYRI